MSKTTSILVAGGICFLTACQSTKNSSPDKAQATAEPATEETTPTMQKTGFEYPATQKITHVDNYHGTEVPDPYRWLENDTTKAVASWVQAQNKITFC